MEKQVNNMQQFVLAGKPVLMSQKHLKWFKKFMVGLLYIVLQCFFGTMCFQEGESRFVMSREAEGRQWQECTKTLLCVADTWGKIVGIPVDS